MVKIFIDNISVETPDKTTILQAADSAGIYIPRICSHPDIPPIDPSQMKVWDEVFRGTEPIKGGPSSNGYDGCRLCLVEIDGHPEPVRSCITAVVDGMKVRTVSPEINKQRAERMKTIFATHPHACVQCAQRQGCALEPCSTNVDKSERCCPIFHTCELRAVAEHIGIPGETVRYHPRNLPVVENEPLYLRDYNLCINCLRCVRICRDVREIDAIGFTFTGNGEPVVGMKGQSAKESGCVFCLSCVEICPTGALRLKFEEPRVDGERVSKCVSACPAGIDIPRYLREIRRGNFSRAEAVVRESAPLPRTLGQACFHPCETECLRNEINEPIAICSLKRAATENAGELLSKKTLKPLPDTGRTVAIIGAGPSGLTAAWYLRLKGHRVVIYDSQDSAGGWTRDGIPRYRLCDDAIDSDIKDIADLGVEFKLKTEVGKDIAFDEIFGIDDAVLLAIGARDGKSLPCDGIDTPGVEPGLALLKRIANGAADVPFAGEKVVVIGGGNVAIDIARTALRLGADEVHIFCLEGRDEMPSHDWEIEDAEAEGVLIHTGWGPTLFDGGTKLERIIFRKCISVFDNECAFDPKFDNSQTASQSAGRALIAIGQVPSAGFLGESGISITRGGLIKADPDTLETSLKGVFACGEAASGPASIVQAIAAGKKAARGIDRHLGGDGNIDFKLIDDTEMDLVLSKDENFCEAIRINEPRLSPDEAVSCFRLVDMGYTSDNARLEADRCLRCDIRLNMHPQCAPPELWLEMTADAVAQVSEAEGVYQLLDENKEVYTIKGVDNLREALEAVLQTTVKARFFLYDEDPMFSKRESELIAHYLKVHGAMPPGEGEDDLDDLF